MLDFRRSTKLAKLAADFASFTERPASRRCASPRKLGDPTGLQNCTSGFSLLTNDVAKINSQLSNENTKTPRKIFDWRRVASLSDRLCHSRFPLFYQQASRRCRQWPLLRRCIYRRREFDQYSSRLGIFRHRRSIHDDVAPRK